jgi:two-component system, LuxR family, sensor histidine kinase DctS
MTNAAHPDATVSATLVKRSHLTLRRYWMWILPGAMVALFLCTIVLLLWMLYSHDSEVKRARLLQDIQSVEVNLTRELLDDQSFLDQLAREVVDLNLDESGFRARAEDYQRRRPAILVLLWNQPSGMSRWTTPDKRSVAEVVRERPSAEELERMLRLTEAMGRSTYTNVYRDYEQRLLIEYHSPVFRGTRFMGTLSMTYSLPAIAQHLVPRSFTERYRIEFAESGGADNADDWSLPGFGDGALSQSIAVTLPWREIRLKATAYRTESALAQQGLIVLTVLLSLLIAFALVLLRRHIQKRLEADQALLAAHERFVTVLDALDAAVYVTALESGEILYCNDHCVRTLEGSVGANASDIERTFDPQPNQMLERQRLVDAQGRPVGVQKMECLDTVTGHWYLMRAKVIRWVDGRNVLLHMASDITDRKQADLVNRQQQEKLELTSRLLTVGEMASTLAHEINQPLAAIANYNMGCVRRIRSGQWNAEELAGTLEKSTVQAERAGRVVQRVRDFLKNREPNRAPIAPEELVESVAKLVELEAETAGIDLRVDVEPDLPQVLADRVMCEQLLLNLLKNAMEAMQEAEGAKELWIIGQRNAEDTVEIAVMDRGPGISPEIEAELFAPFFTTKPQGMGIGLNICRSIVELHEGRLWFTRNGGGPGITFRFTLPVAQQ